jgi:hypothetical protein
MNSAFRLATLAVVCAGACFPEDLCPKANTGKSGTSGNLAWASGTGPAAGGRICVKQQVTTSETNTPTAVAWPVGGILSAIVSGRFVGSFCCSEGIDLQKAVLKYDAAGSAMQAVDTEVNAVIFDPGEDYPDLIEDDAKTKRSAYAGNVWDGSKFIKLDIELRASASYPHFNQSVFQFVIIDQSPEPVTIEWNLLIDMGKTMQSYFTGTPEGSKYRQSTYVFFGKQRPSPAHGIVEVKSSGGKVLGRFSADGFNHGK